MRHFIRFFNWKDYAFALISMIAYYLLMLQSYPISGDDLVFRFHQETMEPLLGFSDVLQSNIWNYFHSNGRFVVHCLVQFFLSYGSYIPFYICSSIIFGILLSSMTYLIRRNSKCIDGDMCYIVATIVCVLPLSATLLYGTVAMTINYMWSAAIYALFLCVYLHIKNDDVEYYWWQNILLVIFGLLCGSWQESFGIGVAGALCIYHLINIKNTRGSLLYLLIAFGIGTAILVFAPSNFIRATSGDTSAINLSSFIYQLTQLVKYNLFVICWIAIGVVSIIIDLRRSSKIHFVVDNWLYFVSGWITILFTLFTLYRGVYQGKWQLTILSIWDVILLIRFFAYYYGNIMNKIAKIIIPIMGILLVWLYSFSYFHRNTMKNEMFEFTNYFIHNQPDTIYDGKIHETVMNKLPNHQFLFEKIAPMYIVWYNIEIFNRMARFYTKGENVWGNSILPEPIDSIAQHCIDDGIVSIAPNCYMVVRFPKDSVLMNKSMKVYYKSKYPIDILKDKLRNRDERILTYKLNSLLCVEDDKYLYYIKYIDWWVYHNKRLMRVTIAND